MKKLKVGMLALSVLAGGLTLATASSSPESFNNFGVEMNWGNPTNDTGVATALLYIPFYAPSTPAGIFPRLASQVSVNTDGSGKITGSGYITVTYNSNGFPYSVFQVDVTGNASGKDGANTQVKMSVKGTGYTVMDTIDTNGFPVITGTNAYANSINFTFTGVPGGNPDTNCSSKFIISGTLKGQITGNTPIDSKSFKLDGRVATLSHPNASCAVGFDRFFFYLDASVIANSKKLQLWGDIYDEGGLFNGSGSVNSKAAPTTYKFNGKGVGQAKSASFSVNGNLSSFVTNILIVGTNQVPVIIVTPGTATLKGKAAGQTVSGNAITVETFSNED